MPTRVSPISILLSSVVSANSASSRRRSSTAAWRGMALCGIISCSDGSRWSRRSGPAGFTRSPSRATPCACEVRVVVRYSTAVPKRSLISYAVLTNRSASSASDGSIIAIFANFA